MTKIRNIALMASTLLLIAAPASQARPRIAPVVSKASVKNDTTVATTASVSWRRPR